MNWGGIRVAGLALAAAAIAAGCDPVLFSSAQGGASTSCAGFASDGACATETDVAASRHRGAVSIDLVCTVGTCNRKGGSGTVAVTMRDGAVVRDTFSYVGDPAPMPAPICVRIVIDACRSVAETAFGQAPPARRVISIGVTCDALPCTTAKGDAAYVTTFADGGTSEGSIGWESAER